MHDHMLRALKYEVRMVEFASAGSFNLYILHCNSRVELVWAISSSLDHNLPRYCIGPFSRICSLEQRDMKFAVFTDETDKCSK